MRQSSLRSPKCRDKFILLMKLTGISPSCQKLKDICRQRKQSECGLSRWLHFLNHDLEFTCRGIQEREESNVLMHHLALLKKTPKNSSFLLGFSCFLTLQAPSLNTAVKCNSTNCSLNNEQSKATALCLKA